jgi:hypothetical protein
MPHMAWATNTTYADAHVGCRDGSSPCKKWAGLIHTAYLSNLPPSKRIYYRCGEFANIAVKKTTRNTWSTEKGPLISQIRHFMSAPREQDTNGTTRFYAYADHGFVESASMVRDDILRDKANLNFGVVIGDIAYSNGVQQLWDVYGRVFDPLYSSIPTMFNPGNHDGEFGKYIM